MKPELFSIAMTDSALDDLRRRLRATNWPQDLGNEDWKYGVPASYLREFVDYWLNSYDWRQKERLINGFSHYKTEIGGNPIHFVHEKGRGPKPIPLILSHGWPWTFWDYNELIRPLADPASYGGDPADAFEVIVPSLPGFGFSTPLAQTGVNFSTTADLWHQLMTETLGFEKYAAQGGDWGALITTQLGHKYAPSLYGIHVSMVVPLDAFSHDRPWDLSRGGANALSPEQRSAFIEVEKRIASHVTVHMLDPQTLSYAIQDSPVGLAAWLLERRRAWSDCGGDLESSFSRDFLITTVMLYWLTNSFVSSVRYYAEAAHNPWKPSHDRKPMSEAPSGITRFLGDGTSMGPLPYQDIYNVHHLTTRDKGGHFAAAEAPQALIEDIRATFRALR